MRASTIADTPTTNLYATGAFWERLWRLSGINFLIFLTVAYLIYGDQPTMGASAEAVAAFYAADRTWILIATVIASMALLNLMWFTAAIRTTLADVGQDGWGGAVTTASSMVGALFLVLIAVSAALAFPSAGAGNGPLASGLNDVAWSVLVLSSFPRAMLIMSSAFGLWRANLISNALFAAGVAALVLVLLGGTTWVSSGFWAPDGEYSRFVSPTVSLIWLVIVSWVLLTRAPATRSGW